MERGSLFATGLVAGGALLGVVFALLSRVPGMEAAMNSVSVQNSLTHTLGENGYILLGVFFFALMGFALYRAGVNKKKLGDL